MSLRRILLPLALVLCIYACRSNPEPKGKDVKTDKQSQEFANKEKISDEELNDYKQRLSGYFDSTLLRRNFNGGILVAKGGHILYETYSGYIDPLKKTDTITEHTAFHLASTSKPFTGVAIMKLVEVGKIGLQDDIIKYFSGFPYSGVTVQDLLTHRSGLPNYLYFMDEKEKWNPFAMVHNKDVVDFLIRYQPAKTASPGTRFQYCNTNYVLLASIIEKVTGVPFPQYLKETIFDPLGMKDTYVYTREDSARSIMSYKPSGALWANDKYEYTYGDKNVYSTPRDMFKWDSALYREDFIKKETLDSSFVPRSNEKPGVHNYGYGWRMLNLKNGKNVMYHNGKWHGFSPAFSRLTDEKAVIIILGNRYNKSMYDAAKHAYNIFGPYMETEQSVEEDDAQPAAPNSRQLNEVPNQNPMRKVPLVVPPKKVIPDPKTAKPKNPNSTKQKIVEAKAKPKVISKTPPKKKNK